MELKLKGLFKILIVIIILSHSYQDKSKHIKIKKLLVKSIKTFGLLIRKIINDHLTFKS